MNAWTRRTFSRKVLAVSEREPTYPVPLYSLHSPRIIFDKENNSSALTLKDVISPDVISIAITMGIDASGARSPSHTN